MVNMSINDDSFDIAEELLEFSANGDIENVVKWVEKLTQIRKKLASRCYEFAHLLDNMVVNHAEELKKCQQQCEEKLNEMKGQIDQHLKLLNKMHHRNESKTAAYNRIADLLRSVNERECHHNVLTYIFFSRNFF